MNKFYTIIFSLLISIPCDVYAKMEIIMPGQQRHIEAIKSFEADIEKITEAAVLYLSKKTLTPYLEPGRLFFTPKGFDSFVVHNDERILTNFHGEIVQGNKKYNAVFTVGRDHGTQLIGASLLYLGTTTISTILFYDMRSLIIATVKANKDLSSVSDFILFVQEAEVKKQTPNQRLLKWTFLGRTRNNEVISEDVYTLLVSDGKGGTNFAIMQKN